MACDYIVVRELAGAFDLLTPNPTATDELCLLGREDKQRENDPNGLNIFTYRPSFFSDGMPE